VSPTTLAEVGIHTVTFFVSDGFTSASISFTITVTNYPPYFVKQVPFSVTMKFNSTYEYVLPQTADGEGNSIYYYLLSTPSVNIFTKFYPDRFVLNPILWPQLGTYKLSLILSDLQANSTPFDFSLTVTNSAPRF
jgi:hypothetical protein